MGLFDSMLNWLGGGRIKTLESRLQGRPKPQDYIELFVEYRKAGNQHRALQVLKLGAQRFPDVPDLNRRLLEAERTERGNERRRLQEKIQQHPNPILYARLAELFKADNEIERAMQVCVNGTKAFPRYGGTYLVLGQICADREKWEEAMNHLGRAVELDRYNYMALKLLAQVYIQMNRPADAVKRLEEILFFAPGDEAILELLRKARETAGTPRPPEAPAGAGASPAQRRMSLIQAAPPRRTQIMRPRTEARPASVPGAKDKALNESIATLREVEGVKGAILVDPFGLVVAASLEASLDEALAGALITNIYRASSTNAAQLGVGTFEEGVIEGAQSNVHIVQCGDTILAVFAASHAKMGLLEKSIREFATSLAASR